MTHRLRVAAVATAQSEIERIKEICRQKYREAWMNSLAAERCDEWRETSVRKGSVWVPATQEEDDLVEEEEERASAGADDAVAGDLDIEEQEANLMDRERELDKEGVALEEEESACFM